MRTTITAGLFTLLLSASGFAQSLDSIRVSGKLQAASECDVKSKVAGRIRKLYAGLGDQVKAGDLLVEIEDELSNVKVRAPVDGTILAIPVSEKQWVTDGVKSATTLMTIADLSQLVVEAHVNAADAGKLALKQRVQLTADSEGQAELCFISPIATNSGFTVKALIKNPDPRLQPGMTVQLSIPIAAR